MHTATQEPDSQLVSSLNRIEGQVRGIKKMILEGRDCEAIAQQISAVKSALTRIGQLVLTDEAIGCVGEGESATQLKKVLGSLVKIS